MSASSQDLDIPVAENLASVLDKIKSTSSPSNEPVRLIAVSKTKPNELLQKAYDAGQRYFGENYVQELCSKASPDSNLPNDIQWHFIGPLQSNKANMLVKTVGENLACVETVATLKLAKKLNNAVENFYETSDNEGKKKLNIYLQVNTSGEESKSGITPADLPSLFDDVKKECPNLLVKGLMTIGAPGDYSCFDTLVKCRDGLDVEEGEKLELSMGMSGDYEEAIKRGATNVRVGSTIFGARDYS
eukprot:CAMPEP_0178960460 /NCGR_PEP_ID=MMETSP0789-20121207/12979_1 /TAXON_ID=3005 /ORGANISM="Rhizosolenia setigera, Strain CCMP 1694" /LENGTH=244 /DNA_ID=CAMNT_0020643817 /DNA_START=202 /DNA_END=932 /DNA_ORIENTATION=+